MIDSTEHESQSQLLKTYRNKILTAIYRIICNVVELSAIVLGIQNAVGCELLGSSRNFLFLRDTLSKIQRIRSQEYELFECYNSISMASPLLAAKAIETARKPFDPAIRLELNRHVRCFVRHDVD